MQVLTAIFVTITIWVAVGRYAISVTRTGIELDTYRAFNAYIVGLPLGSMPVFMTAGGTEGPGGGLQAPANPEWMPSVVHELLWSPLMPIFAVLILGMVVALEIGFLNALYYGDRAIRGISNWATIAHQHLNSSLAVVRTFAKRSVFTIKKLIQNIGAFFVGIANTIGKPFAWLINSARAICYYPIGFFSKKNYPSKTTDQKSITDTPGSGPTDEASASVRSNPRSVSSNLRDTSRNRRNQFTSQDAAPNPDTVSSPPSMSLSVDDIKKGDRIGMGGNADVYRATLPSHAGAPVIAIKEPRFQGTLHRDVIDRFTKEAKTWQKIDNHEHIVGVIDYGSSPFPWIALEYMDGNDLATAADDMALPAKRWTATKTTEAVYHAHRHGVAHLDLKPENTLFRRVEGAWDVPKVADWGLSKQLLEHSKSVEGYSPQYAAPEQFDPDTYGTPDTYTDIYQLGAIFYELFTGQPPFQGQTAQVMYTVLNEDPRPPSEVANVPPELDEILLPALAKEKEDRYESVLYLRDGLQELPLETRSRI